MKSVCFATAKDTPLRVDGKSFDISLHASPGSLVAGRNRAAARVGSARRVRLDQKSRDRARTTVIPQKG
jgi:hypothetical protein